ncbi:MAG TPA: alpha/beta hydrolase [Acidimicrobiales bacterium]|nr:alpha/beta hydrolase [Acidimicrobiales bacterium]
MNPQPWQSEEVADWERRGEYRNLLGWTIFTLDIPAEVGQDNDPLLVLHGFPTSSFDFHQVAAQLAKSRRLLLIDMLGFGLSEKPDIRYRIELQADIVQAFMAEVAISRLALLTHDMGDTVGGELLARNMEGRWPVEVTARVVTNGSIYIEMAQLTDGQKFLLDLPDERLADGATIGAATTEGALKATFSPRSSVDAAELSAAWELISNRQGHLLLPRTIRYIEDRRRNQDRYTGAIEDHPATLSIIWGTDDPIAVSDMATRLSKARSDSNLKRLENVGHYPMLESPDLFAEAVSDFLSSKIS